MRTLEHLLDVPPVDHDGQPTITWLCLPPNQWANPVLPESPSPTPGTHAIPLTVEADGQLALAPAGGVPGRVVGWIRVPTTLVPRVYAQKDAVAAMIHTDLTTLP